MVLYFSVVELLVGHGGEGRVEREAGAVLGGHGEARGEVARAGLQALVVDVDEAGDDVELDEGAGNGFENVLGVLS